MKKYLVEMNLSHIYEIILKANNKREAEDKALRAFNMALSNAQIEEVYSYTTIDNVKELKKKSSKK